MSLGGKFIVVDGPDGAGKGTQLDRLEAWITARPGTCVRARDPGGTEIGERIRRILLGYDLSTMDPRCEALLFMASRAQLVAEVVRPALSEGKTILCDRFISATCAYQVAAGFPRDEVLELGRLAVADTWPDLTLILDLPPEVGFERTGRRESQQGSAPDAMERRSLDFHRRVRQEFRKLPEVYPAPVVVLDADRDADAVSRAVQETVRRAFE